MTTLLQINSSMNAEGGQSSQLANQFVAGWRNNHKNARVIQRELASAPVPHLTAERFQAFLSKPEERTSEQQAVVDYSDALINELKSADVVVLGLPMYNFGLPSMLKGGGDTVPRAQRAWAREPPHSPAPAPPCYARSESRANFDHIARAGITFRYSDKGPVGLVTGKKAYVFATRGGYYAGTPKDTQTTYVRDFLAFIGITDVEFVYAEGLSMGDAPKQASLAKAQNEIQNMTQALAA